MTRQKPLQLGWEFLIHPLHSPDIAPSDFHLFQSLQNSLNEKYFNSLVDYKRHLEQFFAQKDKVLRTWNYEVAWKMAEGSGTKWWIHCSIQSLVKMKKESFICTLKQNKICGQCNIFQLRKVTYNMVFGNRLKDFFSGFSLLKSFPMYLLLLLSLLKCYWVSTFTMHCFRAWSAYENKTKVAAFMGLHSKREDKQ